MHIQTSLNKYICSGALGLTCMASILPAVSYEMDAPGLNQEQHITYAQEGVRIKVTDPQFPYGQIEIIANGMRWDQITNEIFLTGNVSILHPEYTMRATHLSFNLSKQEGQAFDAELHVMKNGKRIVISCERIEISPKTFVLSQLQTNSGHGSLFHLKAANITVRRADEPHAHRSGITAQIDDITIKHPRFKIGAVPVFWFPVLYRDYRLDYPWTKLELGHESDRGAYARAWIGFDMPRIGDFSSNLRMRMDHYELSGKGYGPELKWNSATIGKGSAYWFRMDPEKLLIDTDGGFPDFNDLAFNNLYDKMSGTVIERRQAEAWEFEHQTQFNGGAWYLRYADLPNAIDGTLDSDQFRADHHEDIMEQQPIARQGLNASWQTALLSIDYQRAVQAFEDSRLADKNHAFQFTLRPWQITRQLHQYAQLEIAQFETNDVGISGTPHSEAWRTHAKVGLQLSDWLPRWGYDLDLGIKHLGYQQMTLADTDENDSGRHVLFANLGVKTRVVGSFESGLSHTFKPRIAFLYHADAHGDDLPFYNVGDNDHVLTEDQQVIEIILENEIRKNVRYFQMENAFRFAVRDEDRKFIDESGNSIEGEDAFLGVDNNFSGKPYPQFLLSGDMDYNGVTRTWTTLDARMHYNANEHLALSWKVARTPASSDTVAYWQHEPAIHIQANRYDVNYKLILREGGDAVDGFQLAFDRKMIDGSLGLAFELDRDLNGNVSDRRVEFYLRIGSWGGL